MAHGMTQDAPQPVGRWQLLRQRLLQWDARAAILPTLDGAFWGTGMAQSGV